MTRFNHCINRIEDLFLRLENPADEKSLELWDMYCKTLRTPIEFEFKAIREFQIVERLLLNLIKKQRIDYRNIES